MGLWVDRCVRGGGLGGFRGGGCGCCLVRLVGVGLVEIFFFFFFFCGLWWWWWLCVVNILFYYNKMDYFIVVNILFYCDVYIILLR